MKDLGKLINKMIDKAIVGCDKYVNNHSTWLIFTDEKKWVIELTKDGTLWYNYNFFKNLLKVLSLDVVENQNYITKWVEDTIINGVNYTGSNTRDESHQVEDTIQNGVKHTIDKDLDWIHEVEDTLENGVKETLHYDHHCLREVVGTIQNGVKHTEDSKDLLSQERAEDTIENGVKHTRLAILSPKTVVEDTIQNGVKETHCCDVKTPGYVEDAIQNGVNHTEYGDWLDGDERFDDIIQNGVKETHRDAERHPKTVEDAIQNGVKKTYSDKIPHEYDWSDQFTEDVEYTIQNGVKHTEKSLQIDGSCVVEDVIQNGIKETHDDVYHHKGRVGGVIKNGIKETKLIDYSDNTEFIVNGVISRGISI